MEGGEDILVAMVKMLECSVNVSTTQTFKKGCRFVKVTYIKYTQIHITLKIRYQAMNIQLCGYLIQYNIITELGI